MKKVRTCPTPWHRELWEFYYNYTWEKCSVNTYLYRIKNWYTKEVAVQKKSVRNKNERVKKQNIIVPKWQSIYERIMKRRSELWITI